MVDDIIIMHVFWGVWYLCFPRLVGHLGVEAGPAWTFHAHVSVLLVSPRRHVSASKGT